MALEVLRALVDDLVLDERRHHGGEQREKPERGARTQGEGATTTRDGLLLVAG